MEFKDRVVLITGSASGMGKQTALRMAERGAKIIINDIVPERVDTAVSEFKEKGFQVIGTVANVLDKKEVDKMVSDGVAAFGAIDILVNNAGMEKAGLLRKLTEEAWDLTVNINLKGAFLCSQAVHEQMIERKFGRIINIASRAWLGGPGQAPYSSAKAGMVGLTRVLALELGRKGNITSNCIAPGLIRTPLWDELSEKQVEALVAKQPTRTLGKVDDIANTVMFFAHEDASFITGQVFYVCGGRSLFSG